MEKGSGRNGNGRPQTRLLYDYDGAAEMLSMSAGALRDLVYKGRGPIATKIGRRTFFAFRDLEAFVDEYRQGPPL